MGNKFVVGLTGVFVIGMLAAGCVVAVLINWRGSSLFESRSFGELSLTEQSITVGVIPVIVILAGVLPWWMGGFSIPQSLAMSVVTHAVSIGIGISTQEPVMFLIALVVGWIVVPVVLSSDA